MPDFIRRRQIKLIWYKKASGAVAGIVGAGGNAGAVAAGFLFRAENITIQQGLLFLGVMQLWHHLLQS